MEALFEIESETATPGLFDDVDELAVTAAPTSNRRPVHRGRNQRTAVQSGLFGLALMDTGADNGFGLTVDQDTADPAPADSAGALPLEIPAPATRQETPAYGIHAALDLVTTGRVHRTTTAAHRTNLAALYGHRWTLQVRDQANQWTPAPASIQAGLDHLEQAELIRWVVAPWLDERGVRSWGWAPRLSDAGRALRDRWSRLVVERPATNITREDNIMDRCPGCVGRGTGAACFICGKDIPVHLRRTDQDKPEYNRDCSGCQTGSPHTHS